MSPEPRSLQSSFLEGRTLESPLWFGNFRYFLALTVGVYVAVVNMSVNGCLSLSAVSWICDLSGVLSPNDSWNQLIDEQYS